MGKMKQLAIKLDEYDEEIDTLIERLKTTAPGAFKLLLHDDVTDEEKRTFVGRFTNDEELIGLTLFALDLRGENNYQIVLDKR